MKKLILASILTIISLITRAQCNGVFLKTNANGRLEKYTKSNSYQGSVTSEVADYDCNSSLIVVVKYNGKVEKYSFSGSYLGSITSDAVKVRIAGDIVLVTKKNGKTEKYSFSGSYKGSI